MNDRFSVNGKRPTPGLRHDDVVWEEDDLAVRQVAGWMMNLRGRRLLRDILVRMLAFIKHLRNSGYATREAIHVLYGCAIRQQQEIVDLENAVEELQAKVAVLQRESVERGAKETLDALDRGEDVEDVLARYRT